MKPILFSTPMVQAILDGRKTRKRIYAPKNEPDNRKYLAMRIINGLDSAPEVGCWEWKRSKNIYGYGTLKVNGKTVTAHKTAYELFVGEVPDGLLVLHSCDNPSCINPAHLHVGTQSDNMKECYERGRSSIKPVSLKGEKNGSAKLTSADVNEIRKMLSCGKKQQQIAEVFKISQSQVSNIARERRWAYGG